MGEGGLSNPQFFTLPERPNEADILQHLSLAISDNLKKKFFFDNIRLTELLYLLSGQFLGVDYFSNPETAIDW